VRAPAHYTLEAATPDGGWREVQAVSARARTAAEAMRSEGKPVRFLRSIFVPETDSCFLLYEAPTARTVREAAGRAGLISKGARKTITGAARR
jgi:hypothetical protein